MSASAPLSVATGPAAVNLSKFTPQEKHEYLLNQLLESTSKILNVLMPIAEKYAKRQAREYNSSGPRNRGFGNMSRKRNAFGSRSMKPMAKPVAAPQPVANVSDDTAVANTPVVDDADAVAAEPVADDSANVSTNNSQEGGSRKKNRKSKGKKSRRARR